MRGDCGRGVAAAGLPESSAGAQRGGAAGRAPTQDTFEGFRFVDVSLLDEHFQQNTACKDCAASALREQLRAFAVYLRNHGVLGVDLDLASSNC